MHFLDVLRLHLSVIPRRARVCLHICGGEKWRETRGAMSRVSFDSSDIQATYYGARSRSFSPSVGSEEDFLLLVFLPPPLSPPLCPFSSLPRSQLTPLSILRALTRAFTRSCNCRKRNFNRSKKLPPRSLFPPSKVVSRDGSRVRVEGRYAFTRTMKEVSPGWKSLGALFNATTKRDPLEAGVEPRELAQDSVTVAYLE